MEGPYNWAFAESLAFGSLLLEGTGVRLSGQDCRRGTFSQRHAVLYDVNSRDRFFPLRHVAPEGTEQARFYVYNSLLSEAAVLGFDYGYSLAARDMLVLWEAQFGDFVNGAQVIIDQFICSAESKWQQPSNIVLLLPHGYEGMGPEHSSARLERFLQLCADNNIQVCNPSTPAQYFHLLRRQAKRAVRKPLVVMTPKSLLGHPECVSREAELTGETCFREMLDDDQLTEDPAQIKRIVLCSGKVYYDLVNYRRTQGITNTAIIRVEQFYPFNRDLLRGILERYSRDGMKLVWCQEESKNMGAWSFLAPRLREVPKDFAGSPSVTPAATPPPAQRPVLRPFTSGSKRSSSTTPSASNSPLRIPHSAFRNEPRSPHPERRESITTGTIAQWHKADGEMVKAGELLLTVETDKISTEVPAEADGVLRIQVPAGTEVEIGAVVAMIEVGAATVSPATPAAAQSQPEPKVVEAFVQPVEELERPEADRRSCGASRKRSRPAWRWPDHPDQDVATPPQDFVPLGRGSTHRSHSHDLQRVRHERHHEVAQRAARFVRGAPRDQARLYVLLREGHRRCVAKHPASELPDRWG